MSAAIPRDLRRILGPDGVLDPADHPEYLRDATEARGMRGRAEAIALPASADEVGSVVSLCADQGIAVSPRGGGTGYAGGAVPDGGIVLALDRLDSVDSIVPDLWTAELGAGVRTETLARRAREQGLLWPVDPGSAEQSQIGGNIATNAGGPHSFGYGVTGDHVLGLDAVLADGERVRFGGSVRKDVASFDLKRLLVGSEGTLAVIVGARLRLRPAPEARLPLLALFDDAEAGCAAIQRIVGWGIGVSAIEYLDAGALSAAGGALPAHADAESAGFALICDADGTEREAQRIRGEVREALGEEVRDVVEPAGRGQTEGLWRWRSGVSHAVVAQRGGKVSEDVAVPLDRLAELLAGTDRIGARHDLATVSWGHAGDGNAHATFLVDPDHDDELRRAEDAAAELFALALELGGTISGEHGLGTVKQEYLSDQLVAPAMDLHRGVKQLFDPAGILNPGVKATGTRDGSAEPSGTPEDPGGARRSD